MQRKKSLFRKYYISAVSIVVISFMLLGTTIMLFIASQWWTDKVDQLTMNAKNIASTVVDVGTDKNGIFELTDMSRGEIIAGTLEIMANATLSDYYITDTEGNVVLCHDMVVKDGENVCPVHGKLVTPKEYLDRGLTIGFADYTTDEYFGIGKFVVAVPIRIDGESIGVAFAVEDAITGLLPYMASVARTIFMSVMVACVLMFFALFFILRSITEPLSEMQELTTYFAKGDFKRRANENYKKSDLKYFAKALNKMADELEIDNESKKSFVANVSHELKTPMTTIGGFIDGILDGTIPQSEQRKYLETVSKEVKRLARIVVAMLNLSKIEAGEVDISPIKYDIKTQLFNALLVFERTIDEKRIEIEGFEDMENIQVTADRDLIGQVLQNLMDNAVKFTPENGTIKITAVKEDDKIKVAIRNSGHGVSPEEIARIFERFYKVDKSRSFDVKGVGLGLYIVKTIINMHDGEITASSVQDEYTEFAFELPLPDDEDLKK